MVADGALVAQGTQLCSGSLDVREIMEIRGIEAAQKYLIASIQAVYESQGIYIHDKHVEVMVKEMSDKIKIEDPGDTNFLYGQTTTKVVYNNENEKAKANNGKPAKGKKILLGLIQTALSASGWLSASSFQQTTSVLTEASLMAEVDNLIGLKENVIIGRLIPVSRKQILIENHANI
jgi:DNA-directed RNA polymerase subunit beta'